MSLRTIDGSVPHGVCIKPGANWDDDSDWARLDDSGGVHVVSSWNTDRGRSGELDRTKTGQSIVNIMDKTGIMDPTNATGELFGLLDPITRLGIGMRNPITDTWHHIFNGFTGDLELDLDEAKNRFEGTWDAYDAFDLFNVLEMAPIGMSAGGHGDTPPIGSEYSVYFASQGGTAFNVDDRIKQILTQAGWPDSWRIIFSGNVKLQGSVYANRDQIMAAILDAADAEFPGVANFFMSKEGFTVFHGRRARFEPANYGANGINVWLAGDRQAVNLDNTGTVAQIAKLSLRRGKSDIINAVQSYPVGITDVNILQSLVTDPASIARFGWRSISFPNLITLLGTTTGNKGFAECKLFSDYYVANYANPHTRVKTLSFVTPIPSRASAPATYALMCNVEIGDVVSLFTSHPGGGGFNESFFVEGIRVSGAAMGDSDTGVPDIRMDLDLSPLAFYNTDPFATE